MWSFGFRGVLLTACVAVFLPAGCASDFETDPTRPRPTRAVQSPIDFASPNSEVLGNPIGAIPLVTVDLPNTKEEKAQVHTIADALVANPAKTQPATKPGAATAPAEENAAVPLKVVQSRRAGDQYRISSDEAGNATLVIDCPSGAGSAVLERTQEEWPTTLVVRLEDSAQKRFTSLEGFTAQELVDDERRLDLKATIHKAEGTAEIRIPGFTRSRRIAIDWVDAYR
jgi:hypothetical protein